MNKTIEFVSYDGKYPNLCSGKLVLKIDGVERSDFELISGGLCMFDSEWNDIVVQGKWKVDVPDDLMDFVTEIEEVVNDNVPYGCCGGCL